MKQIIQMSAEDLRAELTNILHQIREEEARKAEERLKNFAILSKAEVCDMLRISVPQLFRMERDGLIKARIIDKRKRYVYSEIVELINKYQPTE